ncbi:MAG TPA: hypothetical protein PKD72_06875 [Gemmatales bacterium]|nr:hypothetical protein [Gemmatales bacterium]
MSYMFNSLLICITPYIQGEDAWNNRLKNLHYYKCDFAISDDSIMKGTFTRDGTNSRLLLSNKEASIASRVIDGIRYQLIASVGKTPVLLIDGTNQHPQDIEYFLGL